MDEIDIKWIVVMCLTLGLAPFFSEPHIYGKIKWILGGAEGMGPMDWFDFVMHGSPWFLLLRWLFIHKLRPMISPDKSA